MRYIASHSRNALLVHAAWGLLVGCGLLSGVACAEYPNRITVVSYLDEQSPQSLNEDFDQAWFRADGRGRWDIVLTRRVLSESDPSASIEQLFHLRLFWQPIPGRTHAESTQTDSLITYCLRTGQTAIGYDGAGFAFVQLSSDGQTLKGSIESSSLVPGRRNGEPRDIFGRCRATGTFTATRDASRTAKLMSEIGRSLGPRGGDESVAGSR